MKNKEFVMIDRTLKKELLEAARYYPVVALLGPRQSGKTTLAKATFANHKYISFEDIIGVQEQVKRDPKGFLEEHRNEHGIILDEFQHAPIILSYIQLAADIENKPGYFILTGSQNFLLNEAINQTLAGRIAILTLLPLSIHELTQANLLPENPEKAIQFGFYPRIYNRHVPPTSWYPNYIKTYLERDVRLLKNVTDLSLFQKFIQLCAGRIGQLLNVSSLANDCGITTITAQGWLSVLQTSYIIFLLQPYYKNYSKRLIRSPKIYFYDTGLACSLLGITSQEQVYAHYLRGGLFESMIISELVKDYYNAGKNPGIYFWRDQAGHEVDCLLEQKGTIIPIEIKSGKTVSSDYFSGINYIKNLGNGDFNTGFVIYAGNENQNRSYGNVVGWQSIDSIFEK